MAGSEEGSFSPDQQPHPVSTDKYLAKQAITVEDSESDSGDEVVNARFKAGNNPSRLKEAGNLAWAAKDVGAAVELWSRALKEGLKQSVRQPSAELFTMQLDLRMNLARAFMEQEDYVMAKSHMEVVITHRGDQKKALFRMGQICLHLNDLAECDRMCAEILALEPGDPAARDLQQRCARAREETALAERKVLARMAKSKGAFEDERSQLVNAYPSGNVGTLDSQEFAELLSGKIPEMGDSAGESAAGSAGESIAESSERRAPLVERLVASLIKLRGDDLDDIDSSNLWNGQWTGVEIKRDKTAMVLTGPLTLLHALGNMIRSGFQVQAVERSSVWGRKEQREEEKEKEAEEEEEETPPKVGDGGKPLMIEGQEQGKAVRPPCEKSEVYAMEPLPCSKVRPENLKANWQLAREVVEMVSRHANKAVGDAKQPEELRRVKRPFTIHVIGARGDVEMQSKWTALLERLPCIDYLQIILIGFEDVDDVWNRKLVKDHLTPPLTKSPAISPAQRLICRLYKGKYREFLQCKAVNDFVENGSSLPTLDVPLEDGTGEKHLLPPVLWLPDHPLYPDLIFVPEPNPSRHFASIVPDIAQLILAKKPIVFAGYSAVSRPTHEALSLIPLLETMGARITLPLYWNPYSVVFAADPNLPPMPLHFGTNPDGSKQTSGSFKGPTAKYAVVCGAWGAGNSKGEWSRLHKICGCDSNALADLEKEIEASGVDVSAEAQARQEMVDKLDEFAKEAALSST